VGSTPTGLFETAGVELLLRGVNPGREPVRLLPYIDEPVRSGI